jgi:hypothetical protein
MSDYLSIIGLACVDVAFRDDLLARGEEAAAARGMIANLSDYERGHLNDFRDADPDQKTQASQGFAAARVGLVAVCRNPPCPYL